MLIIPFSIVTVTLRLIWQLLYLCTDADALSVEIVKFWVSTNTYVFVVVYLVVNDFSGGEKPKIEDIIIKIILVFILSINF